MGDRPSISHPVSWIPMNPLCLPQLYCLYLECFRSVMSCGWFIMAFIVRSMCAFHLLFYCITCVLRLGWRSLGALLVCHGDAFNCSVKNKWLIFVKNKKLSFLGLTCYCWNIFHAEKLVFHRLKNHSTYRFKRWKIKSSHQHVFIKKFSFMFSPICRSSTCHTHRTELYICKRFSL